MKLTTVVSRVQQTIVLYIPRRRSRPVQREELRINYWNTRAPAARILPDPAPAVYVTEDAATLLAAAPPLALRIMYLIIWALLAIIGAWAVREVYAALGWYLR